MKSISVRLCQRGGILLWVVVACVTLVACNKPEGIHQYTVKKTEKSDRIDVPEGTPVAWFFKFSAPVEKLSDADLQGFGKLLSTVTLIPGKAPSYELPDGWTEEPGTPPRFKTIKIPGTDPPLEVTVNYLPTEDPNSREYLQVNFNRWREQLGLEPVGGNTWYDDAEQASELVQVTNGRQTFTLASLVGRTEEFGETMMRAVMITPGASPELLARQRAEMGGDPADSSPASPGFKSENPETWEAAAGNQFAVAAFTAKNEEGSLDVTVSPVGGGVLANINRWCGQVGLPPMSESDFAKASAAIEIGGTPGTFVQLVGEETAIIGAVVVHNGQQWFFKGRGPKAAALKEVDQFKDWLGSVKFE